MSKTIKGYIKKAHGSTNTPEKELITQALKAHRKSEELCREREQDTRQHLATYLQSRRTYMRQRLNELTHRREEELSAAYEQRVHHTINEELTRLEEECLQIAVTLSEEILQHEVITNTLSLKKKIREALTEMNNSKNIIVHVHKEDVKAAEELQMDYQIQIIPSPEIEQGCAKLTSENGSVTINWRDELSKKKRALEEQLHDLQTQESI